MTEFPKWKYHATEKAIVVDDQNAEEALSEGWFDTPAEALASFVDDDECAKADAEAKRKELLAEAKALGIDIYHTSGIEKIQAAIDAYHNA